MNCPHCEDRGWIIRESPDGISTAEKCKCEERRITDALLIKAGIPPIYMEKIHTDTGGTFDSYKIQNDNPTTASRQGSVVNALRRFLQNYPPENSTVKPGVALIGPPGAGKTHLGIIVLRALIMKTHQPGMFVDAEELLSSIQRSYSPDLASVEDRTALDRAVETPLLMIDDIGSRRITDWQTDVMTRLFTTRTNQRRTTIITTNLRAELPSQVSLDRIAQTKMDLTPRTLPEVIGPRAFSRIFEMCRIVDFGGIHDYRAIKASRDW